MELCVLPVLTLMRRDKTLYDRSVDVVIPRQSYGASAFNMSIELPDIIVRFVSAVFCVSLRLYSPQQCAYDVYLDRQSLPFDIRS